MQQSCFGQFNLCRSDVSNQNSCTSANLSIAKPDGFCISILEQMPDSAIDNLCWKSQHLPLKF